MRTGGPYVQSTTSCTILAPLGPWSFARDGTCSPVEQAVFIWHRVVGRKFGEMYGISTFRPMVLSRGTEFLRESYVRPTSTKCLCPTYVTCWDSDSTGFLRLSQGTDKEIREGRLLPL